MGQRVLIDLFQVAVFVVAVNRAILSPLQALESLQEHLHLDVAKAAERMASVREARR